MSTPSTPAAAARGGHANAVGLRLYSDVSRNAQFAATF